MAPFTPPLAPLWLYIPASAGPYEFPCCEMYAAPGGGVWPSPSLYVGMRVPRTMLILSLYWARLAQAGGKAAGSGPAGKFEVNAI
jgi:hypothetical protein